MTQQQYDDPFATRESLPAVSWKGAPVGAQIVCKVLKRPELVQSRDFETGERATWDDGNPKMSVVTEVEINGEKRGLWAAKPSALFAAIAKAQEDAGQLIAPGGTLTVRYTGDKPNEKNPRLNPAKQFEAKYDAPSAFGGGEWEQQSSQQQQQSAPSEWSPSSSTPNAEPPF
jgi:hypothetical protein